MSHFNGRKKRSFFTKRGEAPLGIANPLSRAAKEAVQNHLNLLRVHNPQHYALLTSRITKRGRKQHVPAF